MRSARAWCIALVVVMGMTAWQMLISEAQAQAGEMRKAEDDALRNLLIYEGPDIDIQAESMITLQKILGYEVYPVHERIIRHQNETHFGDRNKDLVLAFRGLGKSTTGTVVRAIAYVLRNPDVRILITSAATEAPIEIHQKIYAHLSHNETLTRLFGEFYAKRPVDRVGRFNEKSSTILQRKNVTIGEGTFTVLGVGKQAAMRHFDVVFADDLVTLETSRTPTQRENLQAWYGSTLVGTWLPHTKVHHIGTRYYPGDQWEVLVEGGPDESEGVLAGADLRIPMVENFDDPQELWRPVHPERYGPAECVDRLKSMTRYHFLAQMQQDTQSGEGIIFSYADFRWWGNGENEPPADAIHFQFSDLAAKKTDTGDFYANVTVSVAEVNGERRVWVRDLVKERLGMRAQRESILSQIQRWQPAQAGVEAVAMQAGFAEEIQEGTLANVTPVQVEADKVFRARKVSHLVESHRVYFPLPESGPGRVCRPLVDELTAFPDADHDDCVDAFVGALTLAMLGDWFRGVGEFYGAGQLEAMSL